MDVSFVSSARMTPGWDRISLAPRLWNPGTQLVEVGGDLWAGHSRESWVFVGCLANCLLRFCGLSSTNYQKYPCTKHLTNSIKEWGSMQKMLILSDNHARCTLDIAFTGSVPDHPPTRTESSPWIGWKSCGISSNKMTHGIKMDI